MVSDQPYRLHALLQLRERDEEMAKRAFADAVRHLRAQEDVLKELERELERMVEDRENRRQTYAAKLASGEMKITDQVNISRFIDRLRARERAQQDAIDRQHENVRTAEEGRRRAQEGLVKATRDLKALLKHKEKWQGERRRARQLKEEDMLDEVAQTIFRKQRHD